MRYFLIILPFLFCNLQAQTTQNHLPIDSKAIIDTSVIKNLQSVTDGNISSDGKFVCYVIEKQPMGSATLVIKKMNSTRELRLINASSPVFLDNSKKLICSTSDSVCLLSLGNFEKEWIAGIADFKIIGRGNEQSLVYSLKNEKETLRIRNLQTNRIKTFTKVIEYRGYQDANRIVITQEYRDSSKFTRLLKSIDLNSLALTEIWSTDDSNAKVNLDNMAIGITDSQVAFQVTNQDKNTIWLYRNSIGKSEKVIDHYTDGKINLEIGDISYPGFSEDGSRLFFQLRSSGDSRVKRQMTSADVDIWNYQDSILQSEQLYQIKSNGSPGGNNYLAVLTIGNHQILRINDDNEDPEYFEGRTKDLLFVRHLKTGYSLNGNTTKSFFLSMNTGQRKEVPYASANASLTGKYLTGLDTTFASWYTYDVSSKQSYNISKTFPEISRSDEDEDENKMGLKNSGLSIAGWMAEDSAIIMYDKYDIWKVDPLAKKPAVNLTHSYGRLHQIIFRLIGGDVTIPVTGSDNYVLSAFNERTKENGFFSLRLDKGTDPVFLSTAAAYYDGPLLPKAKWLSLQDKNFYLLKVETASNSGNYCVTKDFIHFDMISSVYPERSYNWMTSEVISWEMPNKKRLYGIIYKPQNFDSAKKYPVIINYYETYSRHAYEYVAPNLTGDALNIPWFVSRGYIVFRPDIVYKIGEPGKSACTAVENGTLELMKYKWVDQNKIGIEGHSWGGYETNYIVTHSHLYAAAISASGPSDFISGYGSLMNTGASLAFFYEIGQSRMGYFPWQKPDQYVDNSPVLSADKITTPLLLMNNKGDEVVPFAQGVEFFTALRRLQKKAWMLQYDGEGHVLSKYENRLDYTTRVTQFFDHYLKGLPAPTWMVDGIPAKLKAIDSGLELDITGRQP